MTINSFISTYHIQPADVIVAKKLQFGLLKHYIIYLGIIEGDHRFMANYTKGIDILNYNELSKMLSTYGPVEINRFQGTWDQRNQALERAWSRRGEQDYDLILNNCEHYKNFVHYGRPQSEQVQSFGTGLVVAGTVMAAGSAVSKNDNGTIGGLILAGLGLVTLYIESDK